MKRVFVCHDAKTGRNYSDACRYGEVQFVVSSEIWPDEADEGVNSAFLQIETKLKDFHPRRDQVLLAGDPIAIAMVLGHLGFRFSGISVLKWDSQEKQYWSVYLPFTN